jgi:peptidoglycan/xylan/chitin deacetylase (PgdA/CDA1 family)
MPIPTMRRAIREQLASAGVFEMLIRRRTFNGVLVLCYHGIRPDSARDGSMPFEGLHIGRRLFTTHCEILARLCEPVSLRDVSDMRQGTRLLPRRAVAVTFDDGYRSVLTDALPVLEAFQIPATLFACTDAISRGELFWYDAIAMSGGEGAVAALKTAPYAEWRAAVEHARRRVSADAPTAPLTPADVECLARHPLISFGGHSHRHPILARGDAAAERDEISVNLDALEQWTGERPRAFAYPNGRRGHDYTQRTEHVLAEHGIDLAFGTDEGFATVTAPALALPRFTMTSELSAAHLLNRLARVWQ